MTASGLLEGSGNRTFTAARRPVSPFSALNTAPIPPSPIFARIVYPPTVSPMSEAVNITAWRSLPLIGPDRAGILRRRQDWARSVNSAHGQSREVGSLGGAGATSSRHDPRARTARDPGLPRPCLHQRLGAAVRGAVGRGERR